MRGSLALLRSDLRLRWRSTLWWVLGTMALVALVDAFYPSIAGDPAFDEMMQEIPESLRPLIGPDSLTSPVGYLSSQLYLVFLPAVLLVFAIGRGTSALAGEEEAHTLDLLLAQPVSRTSLYVQKLAGLVAGVLVLALASLVPTLLLAGPTGLDLPITSLVSVTVQLAGLLILFGVIALAVSAAVGRKGAGITVAAGFAFLTFLIDGLGQSVEWLGHLRPLTPWRWYDATAALQGDSVGLSLLVLLAAAAILAGLGLLMFQRRNLRS
jgi:ABC-2 type transport system permease protein